jgi:hypothetical protein
VVEIQAGNQIHSGYRGVAGSGAVISVCWGTPTQYGAGHTEPCYELSIPTIDNFVARLFKLCRMNPEVYLAGLSKEAQEVLQKDNACWEEWFPRKPS